MSVSHIGIQCKVWACALGLLLFGVLSGCDGGTPTLVQQIDQAGQKWHSQKISSYQIKVLHIQSIWHLQIQTITVKDGQVVDQSAVCMPAPAEGGICQVKPFEANDYTVPGLFATARQYAGFAGGKWTTITFDDRYGFPSSIVVANKAAYDGDQVWRVETFTVLQ